MYLKQKDTNKKGSKMSVEFKVDGFTELYKAMDELAEEIGKGKTDRIWRNALAYAFEPVLQDAKTYAPKDSGQLADRIYMKVHRPMARDKAGQRYDGEMYMARVTASTVRDESVLKVVLNKRGKFQSVWTNKRPVAISNEFGNARTPMKQFLRPALRNNIDKVISRLGQSIWSEIKWGKYAKGK